MVISTALIIEIHTQGDVQYWSV